MRSPPAVLPVNFAFYYKSEWMLSPVTLLLLCFFVGVVLLFLLLLGCVLCTAYRRRQGAKSNAKISSLHKRNTTSISGSSSASVSDLPGGVSLELGNGNSLSVEEEEEEAPHVSAPIPRRIDAEFSKHMLIVELPRHYQPATEDPLPTL